MTMIFKAINATDLKNSMGKILDEVTEHHVVQIVKRTTNKSNAVILSEEIYTKMRKTIDDLNEAQLKLAQSQLNEGDFESFVINEDGSKTCTD